MQYVKCNIQDINDTQYMIYTMKCVIYYIRYVVDDL